MPHKIKDKENAIPTRTYDTRLSTKRGTKRKAESIQSSVKKTKDPSKPRLVAMRTKHDATEKKSSAVFNRTILKELSKNTSQEIVEKTLGDEIRSKVKNYRPPHKHVYKKQKLVGVITPEKKTYLPKTGEAFGGLVTFFGQQTPAKDQETPKKTLSKHSEFIQTSPFAAVKANTGTKAQIIKITPKLLKKAEKKIIQNHGRRNVSQNKTMANPGESEKKSSATLYAGATQDFAPELKWEWLHFIAHKFLADLSQNEKNLGCGTNHANTEMMFVEYQIPHIAAAYPKGFYLKIDPVFIEGTQILQKINYTVTTDDFNITFVFNAQKQDKPNYLNYEYTGALVATALKLRNGQEVISNQESDKYPRDHLFYSPSPAFKRGKKSSAVTRDTSPIGFDLDESLEEKKQTPRKHR